MLDSEFNLSITYSHIWTIKQDQGNCFLVSHNLKVVEQNVRVVSL